MNILPAEAGSGIIFKRIDLEGAPTVPAIIDYVTDTSRGTTIEKGQAKVSTIEHVMAALWMNGVDNAVIEVDASEVPIMDGSSRECSDAVLAVGLKELAADIEYYTIPETVKYTNKEKGVEIVVIPYDTFGVTVHIDYGSKVLGNQYAEFSCGDDFAKEIAPCRTFVFMHELEPLLKNNLIKGGDLDNAIVIVENPVSDAEMNHLSQLFGKHDIKISGGYLNNLELRFYNEPARHKLLDILGDFSLLGRRIKGRIYAKRPGHLANTETVKILKKMMRTDTPAHRYDALKEPVYDINQIKKLLPHRPPFLLVDKIIHIDSQSVAGIKNVTMNEPFFVGHFPDEPVMPGVLVVEAMAQCGGILALHDVPDPENFSTYFAKIDGVKFKRKVVPGDTLHFELRLTEPIRRGIVMMEAKAYIAGQLATEAMLVAQVIRNKKVAE
jgi:UDP-3-O-[3-hydroxymyristoyl] N-acetylglucosamine deacetylase/3-hydroxyacyl-[acyl-carrier-protein] dehydratase